MRPDFFWNNWEDPFKTIYRVLLLIFFGSIGYYIFTYLSGSSFVIDWETANTITPVKTLFDTLHIGLYSFPVFVDNYVIQQGFEASDLQIHEWPAVVLLIWLGIFISIILSLITDLSRFWFLVCVVLFTILLVGLKLDYLVLFNQYNKVGLGVAFVLYYPALYIFHFVKRDIGFLSRLMIYLGATVIFAFIIYKFSNVPVPFLHLANYGVYVPLVLTIIFTFMIGHEMISGLLRVISSGALTGEKSGLYHFLIISVIYLVNVALLLLKNTRMFDSGIYLMGAFLLLTVASFIGIWGYKSRELTYQGMFAFFPHGAFLYIILAITAHLTMAYFFISGNDFMVEVIEDAIVFSQLAYGVMFVVYFLANFFDLLRQNVDVGKVLYKPLRMPYFTSRLAGLIAILALFFKFNMTPYNQAVAGFYSGIGDLYLYAKDHLSAREYYTLSSVYSGTSHRANFAMATMERRNQNAADEIRLLKQAIKKNPTEYAFANLAARLREKESYFEALFTLQDGLEEFPESGALMNNLGLVYQDLNNIDSAFFQLNTATQFRDSRSMAQANIYALLRMKELSIKTDTLDFLLKETSYMPAINNLVVLSNDLGKQVADQGTVKFEEPDEAQIDQVVYNYNKLLNEPALADTVLLEEMRVFYDSGNTSWFQDNMNKASALALYRQKNMAAAFERLNLLAFYNREDDYNSLLGMFALSIDAYGLAVDYFKKSFQEGHLDIAPELAFAYMENQELDKAAFLWKQILESGDSTDSMISKKMVEVLDAQSIEEILNTDIESKYAFIAYRSREFDLDKLEALVLSFEHEDAQALANIELMMVYIELDQKGKAMQMLENIGDLSISMPHILDEINLAQCRYAYHFDEYKMMNRLAVNLKSDHISVVNYVRLFETMSLNDSIQGKSNYLTIANNNPFFEPGVMEAVSFLNQIDAGTAEAYDLLLRAVSLNPFSIELNKAYALQCLKVGLRSYAIDTKEELKQMMNSVAFEKFNVEFEQTMQEFEQNKAIW